VKNYRPRESCSRALPFNALLLCSVACGGSTVGSTDAHDDAGLHDADVSIVDASTRDRGVHIVDAKPSDGTLHLADARTVDASIVDATTPDTLPAVCAKLCTVEVTYPACFPPGACGTCVEQCNEQCTNGGGGIATGPCGGLYLDYLQCAANVGTISGCNAAGELELTGCNSEFTAVASCAMPSDGATGGAADGGSP
jgi:hypothetical protein